MRRGMSTAITSLVTGNFAILAAVAFCFLMGISLGAFTALLLSAEAKEGIRSFLDFNLLLSGPTGNVFPDLFLKSAFVNFGLFLIILLAGVTIIGFPAAFLALLYKGAALGFSSALLMDTLHAKGVLLVLLTLLPPNLILIPGLCGGAMASTRLALELISEGPLEIKKNLVKRAGPFLSIQGVMAALVLTGCLIESFISPLLQRLLV